MLQKTPRCVYFLDIFYAGFFFYDRMNLGERMKKVLSKIDLPLLALMIVYSILGLIMILSASSVSAVLRYNVSTYYFFLRQLLFVGFSFCAGFIILKLKKMYYSFFAPLYMLLIIASLVGLFFYGIVTNNAQSWYRIGFFNFQPVEFAKSAIIIYMAVFYHKTIKRKNANLYYNLIPISLAGIIFILVARQPDLGGALIIGGITFFIFLSLPFAKQNALKLIKVLGVGVILAVGIVLYSGSSLLSEGQISRLLVFKNPCSRYIEKTGYQVCNGYIAIHNGGLFGVGLGNSTQKYLYLPEAHTDFIFPIVVEELGAIVGIVILMGYILMLYRILKIGKEARGNVRNMILCYGTFIYIFLHIIVNLMGALALIPLTGVPLPFLSYGGSYTINLILMLFLVQRVAIENKSMNFQREMAKL